MTADQDPLRRFPTPAQLAWVERTVGPDARVIGGRRMLGGIASSVHRLSVRTSSGSVQVVLKRFCDPRRDDDTKAIVVNEAAALAAVEQTDVPAPRVLGVSPDGADTDGAPSLLMTRERGRVWLTPHDLDRWIRQLAALLPTVHAGSGDVRSQERRDVDAFEVPASARRPEVWAAARGLVAAEPPATEPVFIHGDYQHFNVLWSRGRLSALVDWSSARVASPDVDVGHCRLNLAVLFSPDVAENFRRAYEAEAGRRVELWWAVNQLLGYGDSWPSFIPVQVAGRAPVDTRGMTGRVEELLAIDLARARDDRKVRTFGVNRPPTHHLGDGSIVTRSLSLRDVGGALGSRRPGVGITYDASTSVSDTIDGLGRVEDLAFAPNDDRLVLLAFERNSIAVCDVEIAVGDRPQVTISNAVEYWSPYLHEPHGVDFLDDTTVVVANRRGDVVVVQLPSCDASAGAALTPNELPRGAGFDLLAAPSSLTIVKDPAERVEVLVCNNATHTVTSHELAREPVRVQSSKVLLRRYLECPDGVAVDADGRWLAVSSHDSHRVMLYDRARALDEHAEPDAILLGAHTPHGLRFGRDGRHLFVADASSPYLHVFARPGERWRGVEHPVASVRVRDEGAFQRAVQYGRTNAGAKGVALDRRSTVLAASSWNVPVTFFDVSAIQEHTAGEDADHALRLALELEALEDQSMAARVEALEQSTSYRVTKPLRAVKVAWVRKRRR